MSTIKVRVLDGWAVYDGTAQRNGGAVIEVDTNTTQQWETNGVGGEGSADPQRHADPTS